MAKNNKSTLEKRVSYIASALRDQCPTTIKYGDTLFARFLREPETAPKADALRRAAMGEHPCLEMAYLAMRNECEVKEELAKLTIKAISRIDEHVLKVWPVPPVPTYTGVPCSEINYGLAM